MIAFDHISLNCRDVAAQERFYAKHFGFKRSWTFRPGKPNQFLVPKLGSVRLELYPSDPAKADQKGGEQGVGFQHLAFDAPSWNRLLNRCAQTALNPIQSLISVSISPVIGSFSFVIRRGISSSSSRAIAMARYFQH
jgi:hypothetical protein